MITKRILTEEEYIFIRKYLMHKINWGYETEEEKELAKIFNISYEDLE